MTKETIIQKVNEVLADKLGFEVSDIKPESLLHEDLTVDSLDCVELLMEYEKVFDIHIKDEDAEQCDTVQKVYDLIETLV